MTPQTPSDRRLRGALAFSGVVVPAVGVAVWVLSVPTGDEGLAFLEIGITVALALCAVFAVWVLISAVLGVRPAWAHPVGRWAWGWAIACCVILGVVGFTHASNDSMASALLYACGLLSTISGAIGLTIAAIPPRGWRGAGEPRS